MFTKRNKTPKKERIVEIDFIRGVLIWFMVVDHLFFDFWGILPSFFTPYSGVIVSLEAVGSWYWNWPLRVGFRFFVLSMFFLISGISSSFSKNNLKRGLIILAVGIVISLGFFTFGKISGSGDYIFFGAITCFGISILIYWLLRFIFNKCFPKYIYDFRWIMLALGILIIGIGLIFDCWNIRSQGPPISKTLSWQTFFPIMIGKYQNSGASDWTPLFPYLGFLFIGSFIGETFYYNRKSYFKPLPEKPSNDAPKSKKIFYYSLLLPYKGIKSAITFSGKYSLFFYLLHQIILIFILGIVLLSMGYTITL